MRDVKLVVRLQSDIRDQFQELASAQGVTMSALAAYLIGQHVYQQGRLLGPFMDQMKAELLRLKEEEVASGASLDTEKSES